jgi:hypothetical protein
MQHFLSSNSLTDMKRISPLSIIISLVLIILTGCPPRPVENCTRYNTDTAWLPVNVIRPLSEIRVYDTLFVEAEMNDSVKTVGGNNFVQDFSTLNCNMQAYRVETVSGAYLLNYANIEFNPVLKTGQFMNYGGTGYGFYFNRNKPLNKLKVGLVPGKPGLYLVTLNSSSYVYSEYYFYNNNIPCTQFMLKSKVAPDQQGREYWDSLNTSQLRLSGGGDYPIAEKDRSDYFFVRVNP